MSTTFVLTTSIDVDEGVAGEEFENNLTEASLNETAYSNSSSNGTAYQCQGATKEEMKLYEVLAWWMDAICQVAYITGVTFNDVANSSTLLLLLSILAF
jgi:hypothetical protein